MTTGGAMAEQLRELLVHQVRPHAATWHRRGRVPPEILHRLGQLSVFAPDRPVTGLLELTGLLPLGGCPGLSTAVLAHLVAVRLLHQLGTGEVRAQLLQPMQRGELIAALALPAGSGSPCPVEAVRDQDHWRLTGTVPLLGSVAGDLALVAALTGKRGWFAGTGLSLLLLDLSSNQEGDDLRLLPVQQVAPVSRTLRLRQAMVPLHRLVGEAGTAARALLQEQAVLSLLASQLVVEQAELQRQQLPQPAPQALRTAIRRARRAMTRAAARAASSSRFRRSCAVAEHRVRAVTAALLQARLASCTSWDLVNDAWQHAAGLGGPAPADTGPRPPRRSRARAAPPPPVADQPTAASLLSSLPDRLRTERAAGLAASFHFQLAGTTGGVWTVRVAEGSCQVEQGLLGEADCVVRMKATTFVGIETGTVNPQAAYLTGRLKASRPELLLRFRKLFRPFTPAGPTPEADR